MSDDDTSKQFDPATYAIPLLRKAGSMELGIGTGFLGRRKGVASIYTAAHVVYGKHPVQTFGWDGWPAGLGAFVNHDGAPTPFDVFTVIKPTAPAVIAGAFPNFSYRSGLPFMLDAVRFHPGNMSALVAACEAKFSVVDLDVRPPSLSAGDTLVCAGFPLPSDFNEPHGRWPYAVADRQSGQHVRVSQGHIQATIRSVPGHSGGPAFTESGQFVGMVVGSNPEPGYYYEIARIVTASDIASL